MGVPAQAGERIGRGCGRVMLVATVIAIAVFVVALALAAVTGGGGI